MSLKLQHRKYPPQSGTACTYTVLASISIQDYMSEQARTERACTAQLTSDDRRRIPQLSQHHHHHHHHQQQQQQQQLSAYHSSHSSNVASAKRAVAQPGRRKRQRVSTTDSADSTDCLKIDASDHTRFLLLTFPIFPLFSFWSRTVDLVKLTCVGF